MVVSPDFGCFPFGTHVFREPHQDEGELFADLPLLQRLGFNMVKIQESWSIDEPEEGVYDFSRVERLLGRTQELGLKVYLGLTMEQAPAWLWQKFPDCRLMYANGLPYEDPTQYLLPADGKPGPCWDHPGAREAAESFITELVRRLGRFDNIMVWNTWQEISFWPNDGAPLGFCYCPHTLAGFRVWLRGKYGSLDQLNRQWGTGYGSWEEVEPPRRHAFNPPFIDWRYYMDDVYLTRTLEWKTAAIRENDAQSRPVFSHVGSPKIGSGAEWKWAATGDFFGNSNYPAWGGPHPWDHDAGDHDRADWHKTMLRELWDALMLRGDVCRSAAGQGAAFWGAEFQGGPISSHLHSGRTPTPEDIRRWMLGGLASGMHAISFWNHRAERAWQECNGFGLLDPRGATSDRIEEAARVGRAINTEWELFALGEPPTAPIAILVNEDLYHFCEGSETDALQLLTYEVRGLYATLWRLGVPCDFLDEDSVARGGLAGYAAALLPFPVSLDAMYFADLQIFVEQGGLLVSGASPGRFDRFGFAPRAQMVDGGEALFGVRHRSLQLVAEADDRRRWQPLVRGYGEVVSDVVLEGAGPYTGLQARADFQLQTFELAGAEPLLTHKGDVVAACNRVGAGRAVLIGTHLGLGATAYPDQFSDAFVASLLEREAGIRPDRVGRLLRRRRQYGNREAWFLINPTDEAVTECVDLEGSVRTFDLLDEATSVIDGRADVEVAPVGLRCLVLER